jgi:hypothetical protein
MPASSNRSRLSTTIAPETRSFLEALVEAGKAESMGEAVDIAVAHARRAENRARLERDTAAYFHGLKGRAHTEEARLEAALVTLVDEVESDD